MKFFTLIALVALTQSRMLMNDSQNLAQLSSDPIHGSLGPKPIDPRNLTPGQRFEYEMRKLKPLPIVLDSDVIATEKSIKTAEDDIGEDLVKPEEIEKFDEAAEKAKKAAAEYKEELQGEGWQGVYSLHQKATQKMI